MTQDQLHSATLAETRVWVRPARPAVWRPVVWRNRLVAALTGLAVMLMGAMPAHAATDDLAAALAAIGAQAIVTAEADANGPTAADPWPKPGHANSRRVPEFCAIEIASGRTNVTVYAEGCLRDEGFSWRLPQKCAGSIRIYGQRDRIYSAQCLRDAGFRVGGGRGY